jgi:hypothetical protein
VNSFSIIEEFQTNEQFFNNLKQRTFVQPFLLSFNPFLPILIFFRGILYFFLKKMDAELQRVNEEIAALEERQLLLTASVNRTALEEAELSLLPGKLSRLEARYNTLVTALATATARTQGTFNLRSSIRYFNVCS